MINVNPAPSLEDAYRTCRQIARREAKNFYYAFLALPAAKRDAICAVYAFMRQADDLADDESDTREHRRARLSQWLNDWNAAVHSGVSGDPVFVALADARLRCNIPLELLEKLVAGTAMDLDPAYDPAPGGGATTAPVTYSTFVDLYEYCYLVASVVGLVCIRIFGYTDPAAEHLAEELGIAFQLTNILRDIREDAERGRIYLPLEDLAAQELSPQLILEHGARPVSSAVRKLLGIEALRAESYYRAGRRLLPLIDADSRPALWVLIAIYHRLLTRITRARFEVFSARIRVPAREKLGILAWGLLGTARHRLLGRLSR